MPNYELHVYALYEHDYNPIVVLMNVHSHKHIMIIM